MDKKKEFLSLIKPPPESNVRFSEDHFPQRAAFWGVSQTQVEDYIYNRAKDLILVEEGTSTRGLKRYRALYRYSKSKVLLLVIDLEDNGVLKVVTETLAPENKQREAARNALRYSRIAPRL